MTPFRNDAGNPWTRESDWPHMPQAPLKLGGWRVAAPLAQPLAPEPMPPIVEPQPAPFAPPARFAAAPVRRTARARRELRLTPLIAAGAVGAGGLLALGLLIGVARAPREAIPRSTPTSALAVGKLVGEAAAPASARPALPPPMIAATAPPAPTLTATTRPPRAAAVHPPVPVSSIGQLELPAPQPLTSFDSPSPPPIGPPPAAALNRPAPPPDRDAPIPRRIPDPD